jgi:hypothetical protein
MGGGGGLMVSSGPGGGGPLTGGPTQALAQANEETWLLMGTSAPSLLFQPRPLPICIRGWCVRTRCRVSLGRR